MKKISLIFLLALASCHGQDKQFSADALSQPLMSAQGGEVTLAGILQKHKGHNLVIENWASWCGDCVKAMPKIKQLQAAHPEADYIFISMDKTEAKWKEGIARHELTGDHYWASEGMKGSFGKSIDLDWIPRYIVIGKDGKVALYRAIETDFDKIDKTLNALK